MLEFFRKYQRYFIILVTVMVVTSFSFFGSFSTFRNDERRDEKVAFHNIDGKAVMQSEVARLARFIATDRDDFLLLREGLPNLCNDGVIRKDFLKTQVANLIVSSYFEGLQGDIETRLEKAKTFRPYSHPQADDLSAKAVWDRMAPAINFELTALAAEKEVSPKIFTRLAHLYQLQSQIPPEFLRRILMYQHQQFSGLPVDQRLSYYDLSLFGFHSLTDWFGRNFIDLVAQFILNGAVEAAHKGYTVSLEEAKGNLIYNFQESLQKIKKGGQQVDVTFSSHLQSLGFDEATAASVWREVLLFRRYFEDVGASTFLDKLPLTDFHNYTHETAIVDQYTCHLKHSKELQHYIKSVCPKGKEAILSLSEVEKICPEIVRTDYKAKVAKVNKEKVALRASLKEVWDWEVADTNWNLLRKTFSFVPEASSREARFAALEALQPKDRNRLESFARSALVDAHPSWVDEALAAAPLMDKSWSVKGDQEPISTLQDRDTWVRVENLEKVREKHVLTFLEAKNLLSELVKSQDAIESKEHPFLSFGKEALAALKKNPNDFRYLKVGDDPLSDQFKFEKKQLSIQRTSKESWMKDQVFCMMPDQWSPIKVAEDGEITFFYLKDKKSSQEPIFDQLSAGKELLAADAKRFLAEKLLTTIKGKNAIVIPIQSEE